MGYESIGNPLSNQKQGRKVLFKLLYLYLYLMFITIQGFIKEIKENSTAVQI